MTGLTAPPPTDQPFPNTNKMINKTELEENKQNVGYKESNVYMQQPAEKDTTTFLTAMHSDDEEMKIEEVKRN